MVSLRRIIAMYLPRKWQRNLLLFIACLAVLILLQNFLSQDEIVQQFDNSEANITITILGRDDGLRRTNANVMKKKKASMTCNIPKLEMKGSAVIHFFHDPEKIKCAEDKNWVYIDANKKVQLIEERKEAKCQVQRIDFKHEVHYFDSFTPYYDYFASFFQSEKEVWKDLKFGEELPSEMVNVKCSQGTWFNPDTWELPLLSLRKVEKVTRKSEKKRWNVLMLSIDSISQMTFRRKLPKTVKFLEDTLDAVVLNGYNIVGDGTPQAFIPILTGATERTTTYEVEKRFFKSSFLNDVYPMIWNNFSDAGYVTLFAEDQSFLGMFDYRHKGFHRPPTDHYLKPYFKNLEAKENNINAQCVGSDMQHKHWLRYAREFLETYQDKPFFGLMHHCAYSHDDLNLIAVIDDDFSGWLRSMSEDGLFDDTILIVMADHGARFQKIRETHQGQMEERLPFFSVTLPKKLRATEQGAKNLKVNKERLSTPFDIHETLHDILEIPADLKTEQDGARSLSLFRPIPASRNCEQAGIAPHWCTCLDWKDAMSTDEDKEISTQVADAIVQAFNNQIQNEFKICSPLKLKGIEYAKKLIPKDDLLKYKNVKDQDGFVPDISGNTQATQAHYQIKLATTPGRGVYEVTVLFDFLFRHLTLDLASVSHVSRYGGDPHCIIDRNFFLATYCVCYDRI